MLRALEWGMACESIQFLSTRVESRKLINARLGYLGAFEPWDELP